jgi:hypothetical protein
VSVNHFAGFSNSCCWTSVATGPSTALSIPSVSRQRTPVANLPLPRHSTQRLWALRKASSPDGRPASCSRVLHSFTALRVNPCLKSPSGELVNRANSGCSVCLNNVMWGYCKNNVLCHRAVAASGTFFAGKTTVTTMRHAVPIKTRFTIRKATGYVQYPKPP